MFFMAPVKPIPHTPNAKTAADIASMIDYVPTNGPTSNHHARILIMEDNDAVIKMCIKGRSPT